MARCLRGAGQARDHPRGPCRSGGVGVRAGSSVAVSTEYLLASRGSLVMPGGVDAVALPAAGVKQCEIPHRPHLAAGPGEISFTRLPWARET